VDKELAVPATRIRRRRSPALLAALAVVVLLLAGCSGQRDPGSYTESVKTHYKESCATQFLLDHNHIDVANDATLETRTAAAEKGSSKSEISETDDYCTCAWKIISKKVPFGDFKKINDDLRENGGPLPTSFTKKYASCEEPSFGG
jgi:hypothetical protein